jgi:hypothetical protein
MTQQLVRTQQGVKDRGGGKKSLGQGPLAANEAADVAALSGAAGWFAKAAGGGPLGFGAISGAPLASIPTFPPPITDVLGALATIEAADTYAGTGMLVGDGLLAAVEAADIAAVVGGVVAAGTLSAIEATDVAEFAGAVVDAGSVFGTLAATEAADTAALAGEVTGEVAQPPAYGGGRLPKPRPAPVEGIGYGILPALEGEAHGVVVAVSAGAAVLRSLAGEAAGAAGARGQGKTRLTVKAAASGVRGAKGAAVAVLGLDGVAGAGSIGVSGKGFGAIGGLGAVATGRQDDDDAAVAWLLAA